jgi:hypothetical protein
MEPVKIALAQHCLKLARSFGAFREQILRNVERTWNADFVVFPELFTTQLLSTFPNCSSFQATDTKRISGFTGEFVDLFSELAKSRGQYFVAGSHLVEDDGVFFNTCFVFAPDGGMFGGSPCDSPWPPNGVIAEGETNQETVVYGEVDVSEIYRNRERGAATTFNDRIRRQSLYSSEFSKLTPTMIKGPA